MAKVQAILDFPRPTNRKQLMSFLGAAGFYRKFFPIMPIYRQHLLTALRRNTRSSHGLRKRKPRFSTSSRVCRQRLFSGLQILRGLFISQLMRQRLRHRQCYFSRLMAQTIRFVILVVSWTYISVVIRRSRKKHLLYCSRCGIFLCISDTVPTCVYTDHNPLIFLNRMANHNAKLLRWSLELQQYNLTIKHIAGKRNILPDILSRPSTLF
jgi:hypothetical protein